jgi:hypothetical protein
MSDREKKLLLFLGVSLFIIVNMIALTKFYLPRKQAAEGKKSKAESALSMAESMLESSDEFIPQMDWIDRSGTVSSDPVRARSELQQYVRKQATARRLDIKKDDIAEYQPGTHFGRVKVSFRVTGDERDVVGWLNSIHRVEQRQVVTKLEMKPQASDLKRIEVEVEVEKWIIPDDDSI